MIKFTVVTCTYNAEKELQRTLDSVQRQTYCNIEHIIMDGGSRDRTLQLVKAYQHRNAVGESSHEIVVISEPDKGLYDAMNKSIDRATGDYLVFMNAGDTFPTADTLEYVEGCVGEGELLPGVLYGDTDIVDEMGHSCVIAAWLHPRSSRGVRSSGACWYATSHSMPAQT